MKSFILVHSCFHCDTQTFTVVSMMASVTEGAGSVCACGGEFFPRPSRIELGKPYNLSSMTAGWNPLYVEATAEGMAWRKAARDETER